MTNGGGDDAAPVDGAIDAPPDAPPGASAVELFDLGHVEGIRTLDVHGNRGLSLDFKGHWNLWDLTTKTIIARGDTNCIAPQPCAELRGNLLWTYTYPSGPLELRSASSGAVTISLPIATSLAGAASDGSYVWAATNTKLQAWSPTGTVLVDIAGNYAGDYKTGRVFAAPDTLRVAAGPAGANTVETITIATQARTTFSFTGSFHSWFNDGEHFLTLVTSTARTYTKTGTSLSVASLPTVENLTGQGNYVWTYQAGTMRFYPVDDLMTPVYTGTFDNVVPAGNQLAHTSNDTLEIVTLGSTIQRGTPTPIPPLAYPTYGSDGGEWLIGDSRGILYDGDTLAGAPATWTPLARGAVLDVAGSATNVGVVSTASGSLIFDVAATTALKRVIDRASEHVELSADATVLVTGPRLPPQADTSLRVFDVASGAQTRAWTPGSVEESIRWFSFAPVGLRISQTRADDRIITDTTGTLYSDYGPPPAWQSAQQRTHHFSPDGLSATIEDYMPHSGLDWVNASFQIYVNGQLTGAAAGVNLVWLGNDRLLVERYGWYNQHIVQRVGLDVLDTTGAVLASVDPKVQATTWLGGNLVWSTDNAVYDISTSQKVWQGQPGVSDRSAALADHALYVLGTRVMADKFR